MLVRLSSAREYIDFIAEINDDLNFRDPMLRINEQMNCNLFDTENKKENYIFGVFDEQKIIGLFVFLILKDEKYMNYPNH